MIGIGGPHEAIEFRDACVKLIEEWELISLSGEPIDDQYAFGFFVEQYRGAGDAVEATLRFLWVMDALSEAPLCEFLSQNDDGQLLFHAAVFESAAYAPMDGEKALDPHWLAEDLGHRMTEIARFEYLLNG